jgi:hypothetical protein
LSGLTVKLGSELWNASALSEFGMTSITLMTAALAVGIADSNAIAETAYMLDSGPGRALGNLFDPPKSLITPSLMYCVG